MLAEVAERFRLVPSEAEHGRNLRSTLLRALPNESRVSRAAKKMKSSFLDHTPRPLQALVRLLHAVLDPRETASSMCRDRSGSGH